MSCSTAKVGRSSWAAVWAVAAFVPAALLAAEPYGTIDRKDPRFDKLVPLAAVVEKLADGCRWAEGPIWIKMDGGYVLFSDVTNNRVMKWKEGEGLTEWMKPSGFTGLRGTDSGRSQGSNGLLVSPEGDVIFCEHGDRRIARLEKNGGKKTLVDSYQGKRLNSPNDGAYHSNGDLYFTDPPYGFPRDTDPRRELDFCGIYRLSKDGRLTLLNKEMTRPNGIDFSPDEKTLYVSNSDAQKLLWMAFPVASDGTLGGGRVFCDMTARAAGGPPRRGSPDGMTIDAAGNLFFTGPGGLHVFDPDGTLLGTFVTPETPANCCFGDDGSTLYITATTSLARVKTNTKGKGF